jgi:hypothetical protein
MIKYDYRTISDDKHKVLQSLFDKVITKLDQVLRDDNINKSDSLKADLENALRVFKIGKDNFSKDEFRMKLFDKPPSKRGGIGLSRGFGEILMALPPEPWIDELLDAVYEIERYYSQM